MDSAFFPYGNKSVEFLIKRAFFLCLYLKKRGYDSIILACNTLSLIALPFLKQFFNNINGVFQDFLPYLNKECLVIASNKTCQAIKQKYKNVCIYDGSKLIYLIENRLDFSNEITKINECSVGFKYIILACTHFLKLQPKDFNIPIIKNSIKF